MPSTSRTGSKNRPSSAISLFATSRSKERVPSSSVRRSAGHCAFASFVMSSGSAIVNVNVKMIGSVVQTQRQLVCEIVRSGLLDLGGVEQLLSSLRGPCCSGRRDRVAE